MQVFRSSVEEPDVRFTVEEMNCMTLQVVMRGSDGVVLASDTRENATGVGIWIPSDLGKIKSFPEQSLSYACSGDECSVHVGTKIMAKLRSGESLSEELLKLTGNEVYADQKARLGAHWENNVARALLIVSYPTKDAQIWRLTVREDSLADQITGQATAGDPGNLARFFIRHYYDHTMPIEKLTLLAAHFIVTGGQLNSGLVGGLEIAQYQKGQELRLTPTELDALTGKSTQLDELIRDVLC